MNTRVFNLLSKYECIMGESGQHGQLTVNAFRELNEMMKVEFECFASPLNWQTNYFCSAFNDCDHWFGSQGSFFDFLPGQAGSFEVNPPFMIHGSAVEDHLQYIFQQCNNEFALSFVFVSPSPHFMDKAVRNHWLLSRTANLVRMKIVLAKSRHYYYKGNQHELRKADAEKIMATHDSTIYIFQNNLGYATYNFCHTNRAEFVQRIRKSFGEEEG